MPKDKIRYLMGVGTPVNIIEAVSRGVDLFDCVMPSRNARHGHLFTSEGIINLNNEKYKNDLSPIDTACNCPTCRNHSRAYLRHLLKSGELLYHRLSVIHNLHFYNTHVSSFIPINLPSLKPILIPCSMSHLQSNKYKTSG